MVEEAGNPDICQAKYISNFLHIIQEMEENHEYRRPFSGSIDCPCFFQAVYRGSVQIGFEDENKKTV
jgi:hypothetical protein